MTADHHVTVIVRGEGEWLEVEHLCRCGELSKHPATSVFLRRTPCHGAIEEVDSDA